MAQSHSPKSSNEPSFGIFSQGNFAGTDQGVDFSGAGPVPALGDAVITDIGSTTGDVQHLKDNYVIYKLTSGPYKGQHVYVAENIYPTVKVGQHVKQGHSIGQAPGSYPYIEIGFNRSPQGWNPVAALGGYTPQGEAMWKYIQGVIGTGPKVTGATGGVPGGEPNGPPVTASDHASKGLSSTPGEGPGFGSVPSIADQQFGPQGPDTQEGATGLTQGLSIFDAASVWNSIANQQNVSPEARLLASNASSLTQNLPL